MNTRKKVGYDIDRSRGSAADFEAAEMLIQRWFEVLLAKDLEGILALYAQDAVLEVPFSESGNNEEHALRRFSGLEEIAGHFRRAHAAEDRIDMSDIVVHLAANGRGAFVECFGDVVINGNDYRNRYLHFFSIRDGKFTRHRPYMNPITSALAFNRPLGPEK